MIEIKYNESKALKYFNLEKLKYIGKCLVVEIEEGKMKERTLVVGDLHLGYEEVLNRGGIFVSRKMFEEMIDYFDKVFSKIGKIDKVVLLGDIKHDFGGILRQEWDDILGLFDYFFGKIGKEGEIVIVKGNHDNILEPIVRKRERVVMGDFFIVDGVAFLHGDRDFKEIWNKKIKIWIVGHGHPAVKLQEGVKIEKYKCFLVGRFKGKDVIIVPSFFEYNVGSDPRDSDLGMAWKFDYERFNVRIVNVNDLDVLEFGRLGKLG